MTNFFDEIKDRLSVYEEAGTEDRRKGSCPFCQYQQKTFYSEHDFFICHHCKAKGDIFEFVRLRDNLADRVEAMKTLADRLGLKHEMTSVQIAARAEHHRKTDTNKGMAERFAMLPPEAVLYCKERGLSDDTISNKLLGYIPPEEMDRDEATGLPAILRGRLVIPFWQSGEIVYFTGRALGDEKPKYLNQKGEKTFAGTVRGPVLYVTEGPLDQILAEQAGYNCIALAGSGKMPFLKASVKKVVLAFDGDKAGVEYTEKHALTIWEAGFDVDILSLPDGSDLADYLKANKDLSGIEPTPILKHYLGAYLLDVRNTEKKLLVYRVLRRLDEMDREDVFNEIKKARKCPVVSVRKDFKNFLDEQVESEFESNEGFSFRVPEGYQMGDKGIMVNGDNLTYEPYYIARVGKNMQTGVEYCETAFGSNGKKLKRIVERKTIAITNALLEESNHGAPVNSANAMGLVKFLDAWHARNRDVFPAFDVTGSLGWITPDQFAMPTEIISQDDALKSDTPMIYRGGISETAYKGHGTIERWAEGIKTLGTLENGHVARFLLYAGFASSILERLGQKSFIIHLHGDTSTGKTTALRIPASIYGKPSDGGAMIRWHNTQNFIIRHCENLRNIPLCIDELSSETRESFDSTIYMLESGLSKGKALKDDPNGNAAQRTFHMGVFSSGEPPILGNHSKGGASVRVWQFEKTPFGEVNEGFIKNLNDALTENYGLAISFFIKQFLKSIDTFLDKKNELLSKDECTSAAEKRVIDALNTIFLTGMYVNGLFKLDWDVESDMNKISKMLTAPVADAIRTVEALVEAIQSGVAQNPTAYPTITEGENPSDIIRGVDGKMPHEIMGYVYKWKDAPGDLAIIKSHFIKWMNTLDKTTNAGLNNINVLLSRGIIKEKRRVVWICGRSVPVVFFPGFFPKEAEQEIY